MTTDPAAKAAAEIEQALRYVTPEARKYHADCMRLLERAVEIARRMSDVAWEDSHMQISADAFAVLADAASLGIGTPADSPRP